MPIGSYAKGCAAGLVELPETGPTWQAMRLSRKRNFGHPVMVQYLMDLSATARAIGWGKGLYIGDISQPRGGPMTSAAIPAIRSGWMPISGCCRPAA